MPSPANNLLKERWLHYPKPCKQPAWLCVFPLRQPHHRAEESPCVDTQLPARPASPVHPRRQTFLHLTVQVRDVAFFLRNLEYDRPHC